MQNRHQISKLIMKMHVPEQEGAHTHLNHTSAAVKHSVIDTINKVLDEFDTGGKTIRIPRIEIDLTGDELNDISAELAARVEEKLREELLKLLHDNDLSRMLAERKISSGPAGIEVTDAETNEADQLLFYLERGYLPWWAKNQPRLITLAITQMLEMAKGPVRDLWLCQFRNVLQQIPALIRLTEQAEPVILEQLIDELLDDPEKQNWVRQMVEVAWRPRQVYAGAWAQPSVLSVEEWLEKVLDELAEEVVPLEKLLQVVFFDRQSFILLVKILHRSKKYTAGNKKNWLKPYLEKCRQVTDMEIPVNLIEELLSVAETENDLSGKLRETKKAVGQKNKKQKEEQSGTPVKEDIYICNAGIVILHPYLFPFFKILGLLEDKQFKSEETRHYAVRVLHYLSTGEEELPEEHQLVLLKLLCGLEPGEVLQSSPELDPAHKEECRSLLESVIVNWPALKRTSVQGFLSTFVQREGRLSRENNGWSVKIERTTVDILLDRLPWAVSMVKMPWYNEIIYVEW
jgi:hypothetical protein